MENVRYRRGLTYRIGASLDVFARSAIVQGSVATSNATAREVWSLVRAAWQEMAENDPTAEEMTEVMSFFLNPPSTSVPRPCPPARWHGGPLRTSVLRLKLSPRRSATFLRCSGRCLSPLGC